MTYDEALERLATMGPEMSAKGPARKFTLAHIRTLLGALENPQKKFSSVLIAGTNGKGSTAATLASIANAAGLRTGLYTSPHLLRVNERIRISTDGRLSEIPDNDFARNFTRVDDAANELVEQGTLPHYPSFFEILTATAFCYFSEQHIEIA